jgi:hypothetical protein
MFNEVIERRIKCLQDNKPLSADTLQAIAEGLEDIRKGRTIPMDEVMKDLGID